MPYRRVISVGIPCLNRRKSYDVILSNNGLKLIKKRSKHNSNGQIILNVFAKECEKSIVEVKERVSVAVMKKVVQKRNEMKNEVDISSRMEELSINYIKKRKLDDDESSADYIKKRKLDNDESSADVVCENKQKKKFKVSP